jgi:transaldolase/glucose-6-phosphate isomerase
MSRLAALNDCGQAPWLDYLKRSFIAEGGLQRLVDEDGLRGVTSNPSIFQKAIGETEEYAEDLKAFVLSGERSVTEIYEHLAGADIRAAADVLRPVYEATHAADGYVSLECSPYVADDPEETVREALALWRAVDRPNLMIKVPGTPACIPAVRTLIGRGLNINVTLLFAVAAYEKVAEAYIAGLEDLQAAGGDVSRAASVASFFVSRIDVEVDRRLAAVADQEAAGRLAGRIAVANAKAAYQRYKVLFSGPRWEALAAAGARVQRILWASTGVKTKTVKDTFYAEALIGRDTVDTLPPATLDAFRDHGLVEKDAVERDEAAALQDLQALEGLGVSLAAVTDHLLKEGVRQFVDAFDSLFASIARRRAEALADRRPAFDLRLPDPAFQEALTALEETWRAEGGVRRLYKGDPSLFSGRDEDRWIGWTTAPQRERARVDAYAGFAAEVRALGVSDILLLGMGGSSLAPEVLARSIPAKGPRFVMLDGTDPAEVRARAAAVDLASTLVVVSSKSGGTLEPNLFLDYVHARMVETVGADAAGARFVAVTDPGSALEKTAARLGFLRTFAGVPEIGGRYSALSPFGLAPAAAIGLDVSRLLEGALALAHDCGPDAPPAENPGVRLGLVLGLAATRFGRDKVTFCASPGIADLAAWLEQLLAESTGKEGRGLIPVAGEPLGPPEVYGPDRIFVRLGLADAPDPAEEAALDALSGAGHPVLRIVLRSPYDLGGEFYRWEVATAVAGAVLRINPFDQPDVEDSKLKTKALMEAPAAGEVRAPVYAGEGVQVYADPRSAARIAGAGSLAEILKARLLGVSAPDYVALLAYLERNEAHESVLQEIRTRLRDRLGAAVCVGFGPRFQHSTGQAYKGGPPTGIFLQITAADAQDLEAPGRGYTFGAVKAAQAAGDLEVLIERGRRALRLHLDRPDEGLASLAAAVREAFA